MFPRLASYRIKSIWPIFKTKMLIDKSKANLDVKISWKISVKGMHGNKNFTFHSGP